MSDIELNMQSAVQLLGLDCDYTRSNEYVECPVCYETHGKKKLNINFQKNVFRCAKCGINGGVLDLIQIFTGKNRKDAAHMIKERLRISSDDHIVYAKKEVIKEAPIADEEQRNLVYKRLLKELTLSQKHRQDLHRRGLSDEQINRLGYKSAPVYPKTLQITQLILEEGIAISGVPGFCRTKDGRKWWISNESSGIIIPVTNIDGKIQGLKIRLDDAKDGKFRWLSSRGRCEGAGAENWIHISGAATKTAIITEGPMKGDIASLITGLCVISVAGVSSLDKLSEILEIMKKRGLQTILICFDMDFFQNPHVQTGLQNLCKIVSEVGLNFKIMMWDALYKGIDDYLQSKR